VTDLEQREYTSTLELRDTQAVGAGRAYRYLEGRAVPYDTWAEFDWFHEQHRHGSFKRSTDQNPKVPLQLFHDNRRMPIGHAEQWHHDAGGLRGVWRLNDTPDAQLAGELAERGDLVGLSVGFQDKEPPFMEPDDTDGKMRITRLQSRLVEVSMTATPAFADAGVTMVRTRYRPPAPPERDVDRWRRVYDDLMSR
jgi:HK97 family phage prohead protease